MADISQLSVEVSLCPLAEHIVPIYLCNFEFFYNWVNIKFR